MTDKHLTTVPFTDFDIPEVVLKGLADSGFEFCTPIQAQSLPIALKGGDVAGEAQTGTGKTAAFLVACFNRLLRFPAAENHKQNQPRALMLAPTRELAIQIHKDAEQLGRHTGLKLGLAYGGTGYESQRACIEAGVDILIGTPGRLIDYFKQGVYNLRHCQVLVIDEADRMFDLGFIADVRYLTRRCPPPEERLSLMYSATLSHRVAELAYEHMNDAVKVSIESENRTADNIEQVVLYPANEEKIPVLLALLEKYKPQRSIVFINTKYVADRVYAWLVGNDHKVAIISGDVPQTKRQSLLKKFKEGEFNILVATDVAARGLHIPDVSHIFNYDLPQSGEDYVHRIGRTARAGASGSAISFACEDFAHTLPEIEEYIGHSLERISVSQDLLVKPKPPIKRERRPQVHKGRGQGSRGQGGRNRSGNQGKRSNSGRRQSA